MDTFKCDDHAEFFPEEDENRHFIGKAKNSIGSGGNVNRRNICRRCATARSMKDSRLRAERDPVGHSINTLKGTAKKNASKKNVGFDLDVNFLEFAKLVRNTSVCQICGGEFTAIYFDGGRHDIPPYNRSIDQIIPRGGYLISNVQIVHTICNYMKSNLTMEELVEWAERMVAFQKGKGESVL